MSTSSSSRDNPLKSLSKVAAISAWVVISVFVIPALIVGLIVWLLALAGFDLRFLIDSAAGLLGLYGLQFGIGFAVMMVLPVVIQGLRGVELKKLLGVTRGIKPIDIGYGLMAFGAYMILTIIIQMIVMQFWPDYNPDEVQQLGFSVEAVGWDLVLAGLGLVVLAPVFEELIFRGYLFSEIRSRMPFWLTALIVSVLFGVAHGQVNVALDVFALSLCMSVVREKTDSVWGPILMHMIKNGLAFTLLFIVKIG